jgi:hypothetical protein
MSNYSREILEAANATGDYVVLEHKVAPSRRTATVFGRDYVVEKFGGQAPGVRYFDPNPQTRTVQGSAAPGSGRIYISAKLSLPDCAYLGAHESLHESGELEEDPCDSIGAQAKSAWIAHRLQLLPQLKQRYDDLREKWFSVSAGPRRSEYISAALGVPWDISSKSDRTSDNPNGSLTLVELDLRIAEIEFLDQLEPATGPAAYLQIRATKPPAPRWAPAMAAR